MAELRYKSPQVNGILENDGIIGKASHARKVNCGFCGEVRVAFTNLLMPESK